ncbi:MAG: GNAT family protein [Eubacteriales bacterium]|nr:GNAT family protein [Eubacteriales bacterium]
MKKAASIFLRSEVTKQDIERLSSWMERPQVTRYLNEHAQISRSLSALSWEVPEPLLGQRLSSGGMFYFICLGCRRPIGFISLKRMSFAGDWEIVAAIGEPLLWGAGFGARALRLALQEAFYPRDSQVLRLHATIHHKNTRSMRLFLHAGFQPTGEAGACTRLMITRECFFAPKKDAAIQAQS